MNESPLGKEGCFSKPTPQAKISAPVIIVIVGIIMLSMSWRKWPDPVVDFGRELYVPWQLSQGQVLYRDIAYFNGPFSPYFNALIFRLFGVGLMSLAWANIAILAGLTFIIHRLLNFIGSCLSATVGCAAFLVIFALAQFTNTGNYNFVCPYSHELTHGIGLSFTAIYLLYRYLCGPRLVYMALVGACLGLILLSKIEVFLAAGPAVTLGLVLIVHQEKPKAGRLLRMLGFFVLGLLAPLALVLIWLGCYMSADQVLRSMFLSYSAAFNGQIAWQTFYKTAAGLDNPGKNLLRIFGQTGWYALLFGSIAMVDWFARKLSPHRKYIQPMLLLAVVLAVPWVWGNIDWLGCLRPLPLFMLIAAVCLSIGLMRSSLGTAGRNVLTVSLVLTLFSLLLLSKMILNVRAYHYGFALAGPATVLLVVILLDWLPGLLGGKSSGGWVFKTLALCAVITAIAWHFNFSRKMYAARTEQISQGPDAFYAKPLPKGQAVSQAWRAIKNHSPADSTLVVFPEGVMLNYLARRVNPSRHISFMPPELAMFGQKKMTADLRQNSPDYVITIPRSLKEYGYESFGTDYGLELDAWIQANYGRGQLIGQSVNHRRKVVYPIYVRRRIGP